MFRGCKTTFKRTIETLQRTCIHTRIPKVLCSFNSIVQQYITRNWSEGKNKLLILETLILLGGRNSYVQYRIICWDQVFFLKSIQRWELPVIWKMIQNYTVLGCHTVAVTFSNTGNSALNLVHTVCWISSFVPGSCHRNWLQGNAKISKPEIALYWLCLWPHDMV